VRAPHTHALSTAGDDNGRTHVLHIVYDCNDTVCSMIAPPPPTSATVNSGSTLATVRTVCVRLASAQARASLLGRLQADAPRAVKFTVRVEQAPTSALVGDARVHICVSCVSFGSSTLFTRAG
jgi:hypothetical protein